jgi:phenylacetate-CoA ligase
LRNWGFWAKDRLQGSPIGKHCEDIEARLASCAAQEDQLEALLHFAVERTPFYAACRGFGSLQDFPVINKNVIKAQYAAFRSDAFPAAHLHVMSTSGSTGTPFSVLQDPEKRRRVLAEMICFGRRAGYQVGDRFVFTRIWTPHNRKRWQAAFRENEIMFDISSLDDPCLESLRTLLSNDTDIQCMLGYPSTYGPLVRYLERRGIGPEVSGLKSIIAISERLPPATREALKSRFGCTVVSRYSNQENGVLAQQCPDREEYHLNTASYVFEYLKLEEDLPAGPGERARMVVTDLFNRAMPMIRYDTGDVVVRQPSAACGWKTQTLSEIEGRREDLIYDTKDRLLSSSLVDLHLWPYTHLKQFQFIQEGKGQYQLVLNGAQGHYRDEEFIDLAKGFLGSDASISVVHVDQIPLLASGKFKLVVSRYTPTAGS